MNHAKFRTETPVQSNRLRVAVLAACPFPCPRGTPTRVLRLSEALAGRGHEVHIVTYHFGATPYEPRYPNLLLHRISSRSTYNKLEPGPSWQKLLLFDPKLVRALRKLLARTPIDVIHAHHHEGVAIAALARGRLPIPLIYDAHTLLASELPHYSLGLPAIFKSSLGGLLDRKLPLLADGVISVSDEIESSLGRAQFAPNRILTIPNGVEIDLFSGERDIQIDDRANPRRKQTVVYTGTLAPYQGIETLLNSFARVVKHRPDTVLSIISESSFEPYEQLSRSLDVRGNIEIRRATLNELPGVLARAHVAVNPRMGCAGLPQKNLNYMAAAVPIVSFLGSAKQLVANETALIVADGDIDGFAKAIGYVLDNPKAASMLGMRGRRYVSQFRSWESSAKAAERFYHSLIAEMHGLRRAT